jgi:citrate synthase
VIDGNAHDATPMEMLRTAVSQLSFYEPAEAAIEAENERRKAARVIAQLPTIVARHHRLRSDGEPVPPDPTLPYAENFLTMLRGRAPTEAEARAFEVSMILHAEHELNASTFAARVVAGTGADLHSAIVAAICALKGPTHGGANEAAMRMIAGFGPLEQIPEGVRDRLAAKQTLYGFGHPVYTTTDPRARILKRLAEELSQGGEEPEWFARTDAAERAVREQKDLHPNVDLWSGPLYRYLGIPEDLFTPLFECSRVAGQAAHVIEQHANNKIIRPAAEYVGPEPRAYPVAARP